MHAFPVRGTLEDHGPQGVRGLFCRRFAQKAAGSMNSVVIAVEIGARICKKLPVSFTPLFFIFYMKTNDNDE